MASASPSYPNIRDELLMKMSTWHEDIESSILISHLLKRKETTEDLLEFVKGWPQNGVSYISNFGMLAIRQTEIQLEAELMWIEESINALEKINSQRTGSKWEYRKTSRKAKKSNPRRKGEITDEGWHI